MIATAYLGLVPSHHNPAVPADTTWHPADTLPELAFDHDAIVLAGRERLRAKLSYTNVGFALAPPRFTIAELRAVYRAALGMTCRPPTCSGSCCAGACWNRRARHARRDGWAAGRRRCSDSAASAWRSQTSSPCCALRLRRA